MWLYSNTPCSFHTLWELGALVAVGRVVLASQIDWRRALKATSLAFVVSLVVIVSLPKAQRAPESRFVGVLYSEDGGEPDEYQPEGVPWQIGRLYRKDTSQFTREWERLSSMHEYVSQKGFLFWQTGLAHGFNPDANSIPEYREPESVLDSLQMAVSHGPLVVVERMIRATYFWILGLVAVQVGFYAIRKRHVWWDSGAEAPLPKRDSLHGIPHGHPQPRLSR